MNREATNLTSTEAASILGVATNATEAQVRAAYLAKVTLYPPDRDPEQFERIRDAYQLMRDPRRLVLQIFQGPDPSAPFTEILDKEPIARRRFIGPDLWMALLKEKRL
jgi:curved DNA-binding protein CbpA